MNLFESAIKNALLELLEDEDVKKIIKKISNESDFIISNIDNEKFYNLEKELEIITKEREELKKLIDDKEKTIQTQIDTIETLNKKNNKLEIVLEKNKLAELELDSIKELMVQYSLYSNMSESTKMSLKYIIDESTPLKFYSCGIQERAIDSLWELLKEDIFSDSKNEDLKSIFDYFFRNSHSGLNKENFIPLETNVGDKYNEEEHIKAPWSKQLGTISKVLLLGYTSSKTSKIEKKSIVVI